VKVTFADEAWDDLEYWITHDKAVQKKLLRLIKECRRTPFEGTDEHRLVYRVVGEGKAQALEIAQCRGHY
jgi:toxin YoeB